MKQDGKSYREERFALSCPSTSVWPIMGTTVGHKVVAQNPHRCSAESDHHVGVAPPLPFALGILGRRTTKRKTSVVALNAGAGVNPVLTVAWIIPSAAEPEAPAHTPNILLHVAVIQGSLTYMSLANGNSDIGTLASGP